MFTKNKTIKKIFKQNQNLTRVYILALSSIAALILVFQSVKYWGQTKQLSQVSTLRIVDKQIYRAERIANMLSEAQKYSGPVEHQRKIIEIQSRLATLKLNNKAMLKNLKKFECDSEGCKKQITNPFIGKNLASVARPINTSKEVLSLASMEIETYQNFLNSVDEHLDKQINASANYLISLDVLFSAMLIFVLIAQALWVFRPAVNKLNEALEARSDFISRISHEIRNPMNSIMGMAEILKSSQLKSDQRQNVEHLLRSSKMLLEMLNNLVDFSSSKNRTIQLTISESNIYSVIDKVVDIISIQAHDKGVEVYVNVDHSIPKQLMFDHTRLEQVLLNLLNNALKFTKKGHITLKVQQTQNDLRRSTLNFSVKDTGVGISADKLDLIFESFIQEDSSVKRRFGGSGLGLSICKEILSLMGTKINVQSTKGQGSDFNFSLTLDKPEQFNSYISQNDKIDLFYFCDTKNKFHVESYLKSFAHNHKVLTGSKDINLLSDSEILSSDFIIDDSLGIVEMIKVQIALTKRNLSARPYALMRSNFSKENMSLLRKKKCEQFLIKPFRAWHLQSKENDFLTWIEDKNSNFFRDEKQPYGSGIKVLAVDDSVDNLILLQAVLEKSVDQIELAENGLEAVEKIKKGAFDIVFMDIQMPVMDGYTAIKKVRSFDQKTPIYAVTAHASFIEEQKCFEAGFNGRITKPIDKKILFSKIQELSKAQQKNFTKSTSFEERMIQKLLPTYFEERMRDLHKLNEAVKTKNTMIFKNIGHKIKGSAKSYGFSNIGEMGSQLEVAAENVEIETCIELSKKITESIKREKSSFEETRI